MASSETKIVRIAKTDEDKQIVFGEVYAPNILDAHGDMMLSDDIESMAHNFLREVNLTQKVDTNHDNVANGTYPVESFVARAGDPDGYTEGAWVLGVKIADESVWDSIKKGELNGFSVEALVIKKQALATVNVLIDNFGETEEDSGHTHFFFVELDESGKVVKGRTSSTDGHFHTISRGTATDDTEEHSHRFFIK